MPRGRKKKETTVIDRVEPVTLAETVKELAATLPVTVAAAMEKPSAPVKEPTPPVRNPPPWTERVRSEMSFGKATGIHHITAKVPNGEGVMDVTGIKFSEHSLPTREEKDRMEERGVKYRKEIKAWVIRDKWENREMTRDMAEQFAEARRNGQGR